MRKQSKSAGNIRGTVSAEASIASAAMILLFAVFISIAGYCITASRVKEIAAEKAMESSLVMYAADIDLPVTLYAGIDGNNKPALAGGLVFFGITSDESIEVIAEYKYPSVFGDIRTRVSSLCTLWTGDCKSLSEGECVWDLPPNERGRKIELLFGGNLPEFFPVIDFFDFETGKAECIISIDTSLEVYKSGLEIMKVIEGEAGKLMNFSSGSCDGIEIKTKDIKSRSLLVVIPGNKLSDIQESSLERAVLNTVSLGISVDVRRFQYAGE